MNETICCAVLPGGVPGVLESVGVYHDDSGERSDDMFFVTWW